VRKRSPNRIGANPVSVKAQELAPARGRLSNRGSAFGPQPEPPGPIYPQVPGGGFSPAPGVNVYPSRPTNHGRVPGGWQWENQYETTPYAGGARRGPLRNPPPRVRPTYS